MRIKIPNIIIAIFAIIVTLISLWSNYVVYEQTKVALPTAYASSGIVQFSFTNTAPTINSFIPIDTTPEVNENSSLAFSVNASDPDGDALAYSWKLNSTIVSTTTSYTYSPGFSDSGVHTINASVSDGYLTAVQQWNVTVNNVVYCGDNTCDDSESCSCADCSSAGRCTEAAPSGGGGGGGGGGPSVSIKPALKPNFEVSTELIKVLVKQDETFVYPITIVNTGEVAGTFDISTLKIDGIVSVSEPSFELAPGESKTLDVIIRGGPGVLPDIYSGLMTLELAGVKKTIPIIAEVESQKVYFDTSLYMITKEVIPGNDVEAQLTIFNIARLKGVDVEVYYSIMDLEGNVIVKESETMSVETQASFVKKVKIPGYIAPGNYIFAVATRYEDSIGTASEIFHIVKEPYVEKPKITSNYLLIAMMIFTTITVWILFLFIFFQNKKLKDIEMGRSKIVNGIRKKLEKNKEKHGIKLEKKKAKIKERLEKHLELLEKGYEGDYIPEDSYKKEKEKILKMLRECDKKFEQ